MTRTIPILATVSLALASASSCKGAYYGTMEQFGVHKRDILVDRVEEGREAQNEAKEQFQDALQAFQALTGHEGGELQDVYEELSDEYESSAERAAEVDERIEAIEAVAGDLFEEWGEEIDTMQDAKLRSSSKQLLADTEERYGKLEAAMKRAASKMEPVLTALHDHVLYLKHNLNARAVAALEGELGAIESNVAALVRDMEASIAEADAFLESLEEQG